MIRLHPLGHILLAAFCMIFISTSLDAQQAQAEEGKAALRMLISDAADKSPLIGASLYIYELETGAYTDIDGRFELQIPVGHYTAEVRYVGYTAKKITIAPPDFETEMHIALQSASEKIDEVTIVATARKSSEIALLNHIRSNAGVINGISARQIRKTGDNNASEVIRRVPGITIMESKYVMVRGLSQRYNNVWMNGASVPSTEADSRTFSFDIIPSAQLDNLMIVKSPSPEYPADFSGGFIVINTKDISDSDSYSFSLGSTVNDQTHFRAFRYYPGSPTDFLGFDNGYRSLRSGFPAVLDENDATTVDRVSKEGFNNDWALREMKPVSDVSLQGSLNKTVRFESGRKLGILASFNYAHKYRRIVDMTNNRFGLYDWKNDRPTYDNKYNDDQYGIYSDLGAMLNLSFSPAPTMRYSFKNTFNMLGLNRYSFRDGYQNLSQYYRQEQQEYFYNSRLTYNGQLSFSYDPSASQHLAGTLGYSYAHNDRPDRRRIEHEEYDVEGSEHYGRLRVSPNDIKRDYSFLREHIVSLRADYEHHLPMGDFESKIKTGIYGETRQRNYRTRDFFYRWPSDVFPPSFIYGDPVSSILVPDNYGSDKVFAYEQIDNRNSYSGQNYLGAAYLGYEIKLHQFNFYGGVRYEFNRMRLLSYLHLREFEQEEQNYDDSFLYPSLNVSYDMTDAQKLRFTYGTTVNRPEFRELSRSIYYDFDLFSDVMGNPKLKAAQIHNIDLRYEWYPSKSETISLALFYKHFRNPIEWNYVVSGGSYTYYYSNALSANNFGVEAEVVKNLDFTGIEGFSLRANAAYIYSQVSFPAGNVEQERPMQGQSPYIVNAALFYQNEPTGLSASLQYNRIGKRIVGVGRSDQSQTGLVNNAIPDSYEMPRNSLDLTIGWSFLSAWSIKLSAKNLLNDKIRYMQFPEGIMPDGTVRKAKETTKEYSPGMSLGLSISYTI